MSHVESTVGAFIEFDLATQISKLRLEEAYQHGRTSRTLVKHPDFRVVLTALKAGVRIQQHKAAGRISVMTVAGHIRMHLPAKTVDLPLGRMIVLDREVPHDVEALEESAFLLTIAWPEGLECS